MEGAGRDGRSGRQCPKGNKLIAFLRRGAPLARREERAYRGYVSDEQRSERGWIGAGRPVYFAPDAYFIVLHAQSITELLERWLDRMRNLSGPYLNAGELFFEPATESPALDKGRVSAGSDAALAAFLKELPEGALVHDIGVQRPWRVETPMTRSGTGCSLRGHGACPRSRAMPRTPLISWRYWAGMRCA